MAFNDIYRRQVELLIHVLPHVAEETCFALKGGTAINLFIREMPRLSIEVTPVPRGCVYAPEMKIVSKQVEKEFGFAEINVLSFADLYAGKIMAALDRQHPRDLFDIYLLLRNEGIIDQLRTALIIYLISHDHPPHKLLAPAFKDITHDFEYNFRGMTEQKVDLEKLLKTRASLVKDIVNNMPEQHKQFLISFYQRAPDWQLLGLKGLDRLPAIKWREMNLDKAGKETQADIVQKLKAMF